MIASVDTLPNQSATALLAAGSLWISWRLVQYLAIERPLLGNSGMGVRYDRAKQAIDEDRLAGRPYYINAAMGFAALVLLFFWWGVYVAGFILLGAVAYNVGMPIRDRYTLKEAQKLDDWLGK
jgi:hypothetical protein